MKHIWLYLLLLCSCHQQPTLHHHLVLGTNSSYPPYESINFSGKCEGFDIDLAEAIAKKLSRKLVIQDLSFDALILALKQGKVDCVMAGMSITSRRLKEIAMIPYQGEEVKSLTLTFWETIPQSVQLTDIKPIAVQVGTYQENYLLGLKGVHLKPLESNAEIIMDLQYAKSAGAIFEPHIARCLQKRFGQLKCVNIPLAEEDWVLGNGIGVKKENISLIKEIEKAVQELKEEGVIQDLETKWMGI